ncbi:hypothetical protein BaRGS_00015910 [Batillaria attramentaria]|uniref:Uncharacterized protein n=1 Tax=Batillaria attramentaria TaxID=370345 RepID=A0ABD0L017_9CAEN
MKPVPAQWPLLLQFPRWPGYFSSASWGNSSPPHSDWPTLSHRHHTLEAGKDGHSCVHGERMPTVINAVDNFHSCRQRLVNTFTFTVTLYFIAFEAVGEISRQLVIYELSTSTEWLMTAEEDPGMAYYASNGTAIFDGNMAAARWRSKTNGLYTLVILTVHCNWTSELVLQCCLHRRNGLTVLSPASKRTWQADGTGTMNCS